MTDGLEMLAQLPGSYAYINPFKLLAIVLLAALWAYFAQWADKDAVAVNTYRYMWNMIALATGAVGIAAALFVPIFWVGFAIFFVALATNIAVYAVHRNGLVREEDQILTMGHFRRLKEQGLSGKKKPKEVKERVRLVSADKKHILAPEEDEGREQYRLTQELIFDALWRNATVVELTPQKESTAVSFQVDGLPVKRDPLQREQGDALVAFVKQSAGLNLEEKRKPQTGLLTGQVGDKKHKITVRTDGSTAGEKLTLRIWYDEEQMKVPDLGFTPRQEENVEGLKEVTPGLILLSAPNEQGLTTTIYSFTRTHDRFLQNVQMIEFEKEMDIDNVTQKAFSTAEGKTFTEVLLKVVRSDPDIIVLPELRDRESAAVAAQAAAQKQKVYVGLVATDTFDALRKWITLVGDKALVAKSLLAISNQRLVRILCNECKQAYKPDANMMRKLNLPADKPLYRQPEPEYDKHGNPILCQACQGSGYRGRIGVFDWITVDDGLREVIRRSSALSEIQNYLAKKSGGGLQTQALQKVLDGTTSIQEVARVIRGGNAKAAAPKGAKPASPKPKPRPQPRTASQKKDPQS